MYVPRTCREVQGNAPKRRRYAFEALVQGLLGVDQAPQPGWSTHARCANAPPCGTLPGAAACASRCAIHLAGVTERLLDRGPFLSWAGVSLQRAPMAAMRASVGIQQSTRPSRLIARVSEMRGRAAGRHEQRRGDRSSKSTCREDFPCRENFPLARYLVPRAASSTGG